MDETQSETAKASSESPGFFPLHRRRHLRSETYRTLLRIFSQCYDDSFAAQNLDRHLNTENGSDGLWQRTEEQVSQPVELVGGDSLEPKNLVSDKVTEVNPGGDDIGFEDKRVSEEMTMDQIEELMGFEESEDLSDQKDVNLGSGPEQMIIDELEHIVRGNEDNVSENNSKPLRTPLLQNQSCANEVGSSNDKGERAEFQQIDMTEPGDVSRTLSCSDDIVTGGSDSPRTNYADERSLLNIDPTEHQEVKELNSVSASGSNGSTIFAFGDIDKEKSHAQAICDNFNLSPNNNTVSDIMDSCNGKDDRRSPLNNEFKVDHEMQLKDRELEISVCDDNKVDSTNPMAEDIDMEEGEISGGYIMDDISMDTLLQDTEIRDKKVTEESINEFSSETSFILVDRFDTTNSLVGLSGSDRNKTVYTPENFLHEGALRDGACTNDSMPETFKIEKKDVDGSNNLVLPVNIMEEDATGHNKISTEKDAEVRPKKKRGPLTKEKRAKKKEKERKKRAEKNRQLGVRRLKLHTIAKPKPKPKPKPVNYCRHYVYGRCQEGDKCNFSHDVVPLTKSKPCCHFARHSCMKGDDCPFDHQLSKYPCSNFASKGFCSRGDDCMFSHKILPNEEAMTSSNAVEPETKSATLISNTTPQKQLNNEGASKQKAEALPFSTLLHSRKTTDKRPNETLLKKPELVAKGTRFLSVGISPLANMLKQQISSSNGDGDAKVGKSGAVQNSNEVLDRTPSGVTPKGINFLSFGRVQRDDLSGSKLTSSYSNRDNGVKRLPLDNSNVPNQTSSASSSDSTLKGIQRVGSPKGINFLSFGRVQQDDLSGAKLASSSSNSKNGVKLSPLGNSNVPNQTSSAPSSDSMLMEIQPVVAPKGINSLSFEKASRDDSSSKGKAKLLSECDSGTDSCVKSQQNALDKPQQPSTISLRLPSISSVQSLDHSASKIYKESPNLAQKALFSTLAFAAKYECLTKSNQPTQDLAVGNEIAKEPMSKGTVGGSQNNLVKASKLLEFLSSIGSKSKQ